MRFSGTASAFTVEASSLIAPTVPTGATTRYRSGGDPERHADRQSGLPSVAVNSGGLSFYATGLIPRSGGAQLRRTSASNCSCLTRTQGE